MAVKLLAFLVNMPLFAFGVCMHGCLTLTMVAVSLVPRWGGYIRKVRPSY